MNTKDKVKAALIRLLVKHPFFGSIAAKRPIVEDESVGTACVTMDGTIKVSPKFIEKLDREQITFLIAHEAMHVVYAHLPRLQGRNPTVWNIATDAVINDMLAREGIGRPIEGGVNMQGSADRTADEIYAELMKNAKGNSQSSGSGNGNDAGSGAPCGTDAPSVQDLRPEDLSKDLSKGDIEREINQGKMEIASAAQSARMQGKLSGNLSEIIDKFLQSKTPWHQILERFMTSKAEQHHTWNRPNKRFLSTAYLPRRERMPRMGRLVVGIDVSGSISTDEVERFLGHVNAIIEQCPPKEVVIHYVTSEIKHTDIFVREDYPVQATQKRWYGGTDMGAITRWIDADSEGADLCVIFTDGYTPRPDTEPCDIVWVVTTDCAMDGFPGTILRDIDESN